MKIDWMKLAGFIVISELAGIIGSVFTANSIPTWYFALNKPLFSPPNWLFGPVWITLYLFIGISGYLIYKSKNKFLLKIFWIQLFLNFLWTPIFFGMRNLELALLEIILLWISIFYLIIKTQKKIRVASYLLIPYLLWVTFASCLNLAIALLN